MQFEVKKTEKIGPVTENADGSLRQHVNITIGVVGCTYEKIKAEHTEAYDFPSSKTFAKATEGISAWADQWCLTNYPSI